MPDITIAAGDSTAFVGTFSSSGTFGFHNTPPFGSSSTTLAGTAWNLVIKDASNSVVYTSTGYVSNGAAGHDPVIPRVITASAGIAFAISLSFATSTVTTPGNPLFGLVQVDSFTITMTGGSAVPVGLYSMQFNYVTDNSIGSGFWTASGGKMLSMQVTPGTVTPGMTPLKPVTPTKANVCEGPQATIYFMPPTGATSVNLYLNGTLSQAAITSPYLITGLTLNQMVQVQIAGVNADGIGPLSDILQVMPCAIGVFPPPPVPPIGQTVECTAPSQGVFGC